MHDLNIFSMRIWFSMCVAMAAALFQGQAMAAVFNIADGDVAALVAAVNTANTNGEPDTINLATNGTYVFTDRVGDVNNMWAPIFVQADYWPSNFTITINGNGSTISRSTAPGTPLFSLIAVSNSDSSLVLNDLTIQNSRSNVFAAVTVVGGGRLVINHCTIENNAFVGDLLSPDAVELGNLWVTNYVSVAGGVLAYSADLTINNSVIRNNQSQAAPGDRASSTVGGGVTAIMSTLTINGTTVSGNTAIGGADSTRTGTPYTFADTTPFGLAFSLLGGTTELPTAMAFGGGVGLVGAVANITGSDISNNQAIGGLPGGIAVGGNIADALKSSGSISFTSITGGTATGGAGNASFPNPGFAAGGGVMGLYSSFDFLNVTVSGNTAQKGAGGDTIYGPTLDSAGGGMAFHDAIGGSLTNVTVTNNTAVGNSVGGGVDLFDSIAGGPQASTMTNSGSTISGNTASRDTQLFGAFAPSTDLVDGACGSAHATTPLATSAPSGAALCTTGTAGSVTAGNSAYTWACAGSNGGNPSGTCSASRGYTVTPSAGANGSISPSTAQVVAYNATPAFIATPDSGYTLGSVSGCSGNLNGTTYTTGAVTADCAVLVSFTANSSYTAPSPSGGGNITTDVAGGGATCELQSASYQLASAVGTPPPVDVTFPRGVVNFTTTNSCTAGGTITVTLTYPDALPAGTQFWKYGPATAGAAPTWYVHPATISGNTITYSVTDNGQGDSNLTAGQITDPGGPGVGAGVVGVPTLSQWVLMLLAGLMALLALGVLRRRNALP